jgi:hypothetical protein
MWLDSGRPAWSGGHGGAVVSEAAPKQQSSPVRAQTDRLFAALEKTAMTRTAIMLKTSRAAMTRWVFRFMVTATA